MKHLFFGSFLLFALACGDDSSSDSGVDASSDAPTSDAPTNDVATLDATSDAPTDAALADAAPADAPASDGGECVPEGESTPVIPNAPPCCSGLVPVGCSEPGPGGMCMACAGASFCTNCGDGECGIGENACRCPADCEA